MIDRLRLFTSAQDEADDAREWRRQEQQRRVRGQARCEGCGRFAAYPRDFRYGTICVRCLKDERPAIVEKVEQVKLWWERTHGSSLT